MIRMVQLMYEGHKTVTLPVDGKHLRHAPCVLYKNTYFQFEGIRGDNMIVYREKTDVLDLSDTGALE